MNLRESIAGVKAQMNAAGIEPERGLGDELFLFASTMLPLVNVDLLVVNERGEFLLSWRDDPHCGDEGWHVPGGCIRLRETFAERIQKTALSELGVRVEHGPRPAFVFEIFQQAYRKGIEDQRERAHAVSLVFICRLCAPCRTIEAGSAPNVGDLRWFSELPDDLLTIQSCYRENWPEISKSIRRAVHGDLEE